MSKGLSKERPSIALSVSTQYFCPLSSQATRTTQVACESTHQVMLLYRAVVARFSRPAAKDMDPREEKAEANPSGDADEPIHG